MSKMTVLHHLREIQWRLIIVAVFFIAGAALAYYYQEPLISALLAPLDGQKLVYLNPAGGFSFIFLVSIYAGIAFAFPVMIQQFYGFLKPLLPMKSRGKSIKIITSSIFLLTAGIAFGYFVAVPSALNFLYGFADQYVDASLTADSYLNFVIAYTIGIGLVFQVPLLLLLIHSIKPMSPGGLLKSERWVILLSFVAAAIITPTPDPINQAIIAGPVIVVYQFGVAAILFSILKNHRKAVKARKQASALMKSREKLQYQKIQEEPIPEGVFASLLESFEAPAEKTPARVQAKPLMVSVKTVPSPPVTHSAPIIHQPIVATQSMDGFKVTRRPAPLTVPSRQAFAVNLTERSQPIRKNIGPRPLSMDGMTSRFSST